MNTGDIDINLNNWIIKDAGSDNHIISSNVFIYPGEYKILGINSDFNANGKTGKIPKYRLRHDQQNAQNPRPKGIPLK